MAYLICRRQWHGELIDIARAKAPYPTIKVTLRRAKFFVDLPPAYTPQHGDVWLEMEDEDGDLVPDPVILPWGQGAVECLRHLKLPEHLFSDARMEKLYQQLRRDLAAHYGGNHEPE